MLYNQSKQVLAKLCDTYNHKFTWQIYYEWFLNRNNILSTALSSKKEISIFIYMPTYVRVLREYIVCKEYIKGNQKEPGIEEFAQEI